jgi:hypothetical protein
VHALRGLADEFEGAKDVTVTSDSLCYSYWDNVRLTAEGAEALPSSVGFHDVAYMIGSKSNKPLRRATSRARAAVRVLKRATHRPGGRAINKTAVSSTTDVATVVETSTTLACARWVLCRYADGLRSGHRGDRKFEPVDEAQIGKTGL